MNERSRRSAKQTKAGWPPPRHKLKALIEEALIDAYGDAEQCTAFYTLLEEHLATPFDTEILGVAVRVEGIDIDHTGQIVALCRRHRSRQSVPILDIVLPSPRPSGAEWIEAFRLWSAERCPDE